MSYRIQWNSTEMPYLKSTILKVILRFLFRDKLPSIIPNHQLRYSSSQFSPLPKWLCIHSFPKWCLAHNKECKWNTFFFFLRLSVYSYSNSTAFDVMSKCKPLHEVVLGPTNWLSLVNTAKHKTIQYRQCNDFSWHSPKNIDLNAYNFTLK